MTNVALPPKEPPAWQVGAAGLLALAVAMGIGRFAFTPMLPLMLQAGQLGVDAGGWLAAANYAGYLAGALSASRLRGSAAWLAAVALLGTAALTSGMAIEGPLAWWALLRFGAGVTSAWTFVATSIWCLAALARRAPSAWSTTLYAGVGAGIAIAGTDCLAGGAAGWSPPALWEQLGLLALVLVLPVLWVMARDAQVAAPGDAATAPAAMPAGGRTLVACYGAMGFGYILPATYLPALARDLVADPRIFGLAWPLFGTTAAISTLVAARVLRRFTRLQVWRGSHWLMGAGVLLPGVWLSMETIVLSALLVGGTFMVVTLAGVQEIRARAQGDATRLVGRMTAAFAAGQIAGPVAASLLLRLSPTHGLQWALQLGTAALVAGALSLRRLDALSSVPSLQEPFHAR